MSSGAPRSLLGPLLRCANQPRRSREKAGTSVAGNNAESLADAGAGDDDFKPKGKSAISAFAALGLEDPPAEEEDEDFGGLMVYQARYISVEFADPEASTAIVCNQIHQPKGQEGQEEGQEEGRCGRFVRGWSGSRGGFRRRGRRGEG